MITRKLQSVRVFCILLSVCFTLPLLIPKTVGNCSAVYIVTYDVQKPKQRLRGSN